MGDLNVEVHLADGLDLPVDEDGVASAALAVLRHHGVETAELSIALLGDEEIARMNREYLDHEGPTDVISFALPAPGGMRVGDVYIGAEQARRQAAELAVPFAEELLRLAVHGTLHVLGHEHPEGEREGSPMYLLQEELLRDLLPGGPSRQADPSPT